MQTFLVTVLTFISAALFGPESTHSTTAEPETSISKEIAEPEKDHSTSEIENC